jgi:hypothetical protein
MPNSGGTLPTTSAASFLLSTSTNRVRRSKRLSIEAFAAGVAAGVAAEYRPPEPFDEGDVLSAELSLLNVSVFLRFTPCLVSSGLASVTRDAGRWLVL